MVGSGPDDRLLWRESDPRDQEAVRTSVRFLGILSFVLAVAGADCAQRPPVPRPRGLVVVTLDTTRADRLPVYGFRGVATPALDRLSREGVVFDRAMTVAPLTLTAHTSLFTGLYPPAHGVRDNADAPLDSAHATLAEMLHSSGFRTAAFVGSTVLGAGRGLARGFDLYIDGGSAAGAAPRRRPGNEVMDEAIAWLEARNAAPFFLWVHLYDVHAPQTLPDDFRRKYGDSYEGAIAFVDLQIARLVDALDRGRRLDTTAVVVAGDHGESLGEHGEVEHGIFVYEGAVHVPLIARIPGVAPRRVSDVVSLVDVLPTIVDVFGIPPAKTDGVNLVPVLRGERTLAPRDVYAESMYASRFGWSPLRMVRIGNLKFIDAPRPELYDLDVDPFEEDDLSRERPSVVAEMRAAIAGIDDGVLPAATEQPASAQRRALASVGYVSGARTSAGAAALDPKDHIEEFNASRRRSPSW